MMVLRQEAEKELGIIEIEKLMDEKGVSITGDNLILNINGREYKIGGDQVEFPRVIDEPFVLIK